MKYLWYACCDSEWEGKGFDYDITFCPECGKETYPYYAEDICDDEDEEF